MIVDEDRLESGCVYILLACCMLSLGRCMFWQGWCERLLEVQKGPWTADCRYLEGKEAPPKVSTVRKSGGIQLVRRCK